MNPVAQATIAAAAIGFGSYIIALWFGFDPALAVAVTALILVLWRMFRDDG